MTNSENFTLEQDDRLSECLRESFNSALSENKEFSGLQGLNNIVDWYREAKVDKDEEGAWNKHVVLSTIANKTTQELVNHLEPFYKNTIIENVGIRTQFKDGATESNINVELISVKPFVKFVKRVDRQLSSSVKLLFQLNTSMYLDKLRIQNSSQGKSIRIGKIGVQLELLLLQVSISITLGIPTITLFQPLKLGKKNFEIRDLVLYSRETSSAVGAPLST